MLLREKYEGVDSGPGRRWRILTEERVGHKIINSWNEAEGGEKVGKSRLIQPMRKKRRKCQV